MNELTSLDREKIKAQLQAEDWKIVMVTGERGNGMSTLNIHIERRTMRERLKAQLARGHRWHHQNRTLVHMILYAIIGPCYLLVGLVNFRDGFEIPATVFITISCMVFIFLGSAMARYAHGGNDHDKPDS